MKRTSRPRCLNLYNSLGRQISKRFRKTAGSNNCRQLYIIKSMIKYLVYYCGTGTVARLWCPHYSQPVGYDVEGVVVGKSGLGASTGTPSAEG